MEFLWLLIGFAIGLLVAWFYLNGQFGNRLEAREAELLQEVRDADEHANAVRQENKDAKARLSELEASNLSTAERIAVLDMELETIRKQRKQEREEFNVAKRQSSEAEAAGSAAIGLADSLKLDLAQARNELENARAANADKAAQHSELESANEELKARLDNAGRQQGVLEKQLSEANAERSAEREACQARIDELQGSLNRQSETNRQLEADLAALQSKIGQYQTGRSRAGQPETGNTEPGTLTAAPVPEPENRAAPDGAAVAAIAPAQDDRADDLTRIKGIGKVLKEKLNRLGINSFRQIAEFTEADIERVNAELDFPGRIEREKWVEQARSMAQ